VEEAEARVAAAHLVPEPPYSEFAFPDVGVVEEHDCGSAELREPGLEVVLDCLIGVQPVEVEEVDGPVGELGHRLVERCSKQARELPVAWVVVAA